LKKIFFIIFLLISFLSKANFFTLTGYVFDQQNQPIPYVNIFVKNTDKIATTDIDGKYFIELKVGTYEVVYKMLGYKDLEVNVTITKNEIKNVWLNQSEEALDEIVVKVSKKDPAYGIIKKTIENKSKYLNQYDGLSCNFYIKATEKQSVDSSKLSFKDLAKDTVSVKKSKMNLVEVKGKLYFEKPNKIKEIVDGYTVKGKEDDLFFLSNTEADFNFYNNLIYSSLTEAPLVSPLNWTSVMAYKFKLIEQYKLGDELVSRIEVKPRKTGTALFDGEIHIINDKWCIKKVDFSINKRAMNYYSKFNIKQEYRNIYDSIWTIDEQKFTYQTKSGKTYFKGKTEVYYDSVIVNPKFPKRFFNAEIGVKTEKAFERDTMYWNLQRPTPLTLGEQAHVAYIDSVQGVLNSDWYKDSIQNERNKVTIPNILWFGQDYVNWRKKRIIYFAPMANMFDPVSPGGFRVGYYLTYNKKFEKSKRNLSVVPNATYGIRNEDLKGSVSARLMYDPYHLRQIYALGGRQFNLINPYDAYINMFRRSNFFQQDFLILGHRMELFNGFYLNTSFEYADRKDIADYMFGDVSDQIFENNTPINFDPYKSLATQIGFDYTPYQKYIREPNEKIVLGSKWPTIGVEYTKGYNGIFGSTVQYDRIELSLKHQHRLGTFGTSKWSLSGGKFLDTTNLQQVDYKYQRKGDPLLYTNPFATFQLLNHTFPTFDWYLEWHYLHRFNGAIINKLPIIRKLGLRFVAGQGTLYAFENNYKHVEAFAGVERIFKFWRERIRIGVYYAVSQSTNGFNNGIKISLEYFDKQNKTWNF